MYILIEQASLYQNIILSLISVEEFLRNLSSNFDYDTVRFGTETRSVKQLYDYSNNVNAILQNFSKFDKNENNLSSNKKKFVISNKRKSFLFVSLTIYNMVLTWGKTKKSLKSELRSICIRPLIWVFYS